MPISLKTVILVPMLRMGTHGLEALLREESNRNAPEQKQSFEERHSHAEHGNEMTVSWSIDDQQVILRWSDREARPLTDSA
ncbi:MAG: hypothetical protein JWM11_8137 [Planctomycetaceae bacterium]|nr:hypothetical protein [Planctomycetaceae bacterium]